MSTWSLPRILRWRVKEWASCLFPCRSFPADQAPATPPPPHSKTKSGGKKMSAKRPLSGGFAAEVGGGSSRGSANEPHFAEEEYIVFCFRDDGAFEVVAKSSSDSSTNVVGRCSSASRSRSLMNHKGYKEEGVICDGRMISVGSKDSYQSDGSTESFAFPVLRWDWSSSPDRMPKKNKSQRCIRIHCCSFDDRENNV